jgi:PPM family protein phosphatase
MLDIQFGEASDPGKVRANNEDATGSFIPGSRHEARSHGFLFAVADGVGGLEFGEVAAGTAISVLTAEFAKAKGSSMLISLLPRLVQQANAAVYDRMLTREYWGRRMATTLVACALRYDQAVVSHVGDSRCYLVRGGRARQLTQDHTLVNEQHKLGLISSAEMEEADSKHVLARVLGPNETIVPDTTALSLQADDMLVLCTDGLHSGVNEAELASIAGQRKSAAEIARELVARGVELDGSDNTTAQVIRVRSVEQVGMYRGRTYRMAG